MGWWIYSFLGRVSLYAKGLKIGGQGIRFDDIEAVYGAIAVRERGVPRFVGANRLILADGREVALPTDLIDDYVLFDRIHQAVGGPLHERVERDLAAGKHVRFGPLRITEDAISHDGRLMRWNLLGGFSFDTKPACVHLFELGSKSPWASVNLKDLPNGQLLMELCRERAHQTGFEPAILGLPEETALPPMPTLAGPSIVAGSPSIVIVYPITSPCRYWNSLANGYDYHLFMCLLWVGLAGVLAIVALFANATSPAAWIAFSLILAAGIGIFLVPLTRTLSVSIDSDGVRWTRRDKSMSRRWSDVARYQYAGKTVRDAISHKVLNRVTVLRVLFRDGVSLRVDSSFDDVDHLVQEMVRASTAALLPGARKKVEAGDITFESGSGDWKPYSPPMRLSEKGIEIQGHHRWKNVMRVWLGEGALGWQFLDGSTRLIPLASLPNYGVFVELVRDKIGLRCEIPSIV